MFFLPEQTKWRHRYSFRRIFLSLLLSSNNECPAPRTIQSRIRVYIENKYQITSSDVYYNINEDIIFSKKESIVKDNINNTIKLSSFKYFNKTQTLNGEKIELEDNDKNKYFLSSSFMILPALAIIN